MTMIRIASALLTAALVLAAACTSSSTPTTGSLGSSRYDSDYTDQTRGGQTYGQQQGDINERPDEEPPITIMLVSMETGDVFPGDDYYVYAVVDNLDDRDLEYVWSIGNGTVREVPEAERGRLATVVETEYNTASSTPQPEVTPEELEDEQVPDGDGQTATAPAAEGDKPQQAQVPQPGASLPGETPSTTDPSQEPLFRSSPGGGTQPAMPEDQPGTTPDTTQDDQPPAESGNTDLVDKPDTSPTDSPVDRFGEKWPIVQEAIDLANQDRESELTEEQRELLNEFRAIYEPGRLNEGDPSTAGEGDLSTAEAPEGGQAAVHDYMLGSLIEYRAVGAADDENAEETENNSDNVAVLAAQLAEGISAHAPAVDSAGASRSEPGGVVNVVDEAPPEQAGWVGEEGAKLAPGGPHGLRSQYQVWKDDAAEPRRRNLGGYSDDDGNEPLLVDESYELHTFVTDEPYIMWTPRTPGLVNIYLKITYKDEEVTGTARLETDVRLRDPEVSLSKDFPDVIREDEPLYVALEATNIPGFNKGLLTLTFDPNRLSFRDAELGEFFDDAPAASLFYAQPDKTEGKVLLAMDANTMITELGGDGTLAYVKFTAKQDLASREDTMLALVMDTSARYILNHDGENVLPLPIEHPVYRTTTIMPPELPEYDRERYPGAEAGTQQQAPATPATQAPAQPATDQPTSQPATPASGATVQFGAGTPTAPTSSGSPPPADQSPPPADQSPTPADQSPPPTGDGPPSGINPESGVTSMTDQDDDETDLRSTPASDAPDEDEQRNSEGNDTDGNNISQSNDETTPAEPSSDPEPEEPESANG